MPKPETAAEPERDHPAPVWFVDLYEAAKSGDYARAAQAQAELDRLGWRVDRKPRRKARQAEGGGR